MKRVKVALSLKEACLDYGFLKGGQCSVEGAVAADPKRVKLGNLMRALSSVEQSQEGTWGKQLLRELAKDATEIVGKAQTCIEETLTQDLVESEKALCELATWEGKCWTETIADENDWDSVHRAAQAAFATLEAEQMESAIARLDKVSLP